MGILADNLSRVRTADTDKAQHKTGQLDALLAGAAFTEDGTLELASGAVIEYTMRLIPTAVKGQIEIERDAQFAADKVERTIYNADAFEHDAVIRKLAYAVCKRGTTEPLDSYAEWKRLANDAICGPLWQRYCDLEAMLDPRDEVLAADVYEHIVAHVKKNGAACFGYLTTFGSRALASCVISLVGQHANSPGSSSCGGGSTDASWTASFATTGADADIVRPSIETGGAS